MGKILDYEGGRLHFKGEHKAFHINIGEAYASLIMQKLYTLSASQQQKLIMDLPDGKLVYELDTQTDELYILYIDKYEWIRGISISYFKNKIAIELESKQLSESITR